MPDFLNSLFSLSGKTAIVTGASRGLGQAIAENLSFAGAMVFALARSEKPSIHFQNDVNYRSCDVTNGNRFKQICDEIFLERGSIDILVNCAGISIASNPDGDFENFQKTLETNLTATYQSISAVAVYMKKTGGSIINITSIASVIGMPGNPGYVASKGGLRMLTKGLAIDLAKDNIRVNNIIPGYFLTDMTDMTSSSYSDQNLKKLRDQRIIKNRWGKPKDLAGAVILLASDASDYITGADIAVDGGWTAKGL